MRKFFKFFLVFICLFFICLTSVYGVEVNMNLGNNSISSNITDLTDGENEINDSSLLNSSSTTKVSTTETSEDFELSVSDIINIILISVGIVLIFLAIAILIKIK